MVNCQHIKKFKQLNLIVGKGLMKCGGGALGKKAKQNCSSRVSLRMKGEFSATFEFI
jgi:hypothetical protein